MWVGGIGEVEKHAVPQQLDDAAAVAGRDLAHELSERDGHVCGNLVAGLLGQHGVAGQVREHRGLGSAWRTAPHAGVLERRLHVVDLVGGHEDLLMTTE
jgi:hypothetical protein